MKANPVISESMSEVHSIRIGDTVRCSPHGNYVLPAGLPSGAIAEVEATFLSTTYGSVTYVSYRGKVFKVPDACIYPLEATFAIADIFNAT